MLGNWQLDSVNNTDLLTLCAGLPDASIDCILCDLPYGTTACSWDEIIPFEPMWAAFKRVIKPRGAIVLTASQPFTSKLVMSNIEMFRYEWIWQKTKPTQFLDAGRKPLKEHENVLVFGKAPPAYYPQGLQRSGKQQNGKGKSGSLYGSTKEVYIQEWINYPRTVQKFASDINGNHPTQKPVALFEYLIRTYTQPGDLVLDPTVGSGTTAVAARNTNRRYIVGDTSAEYYEIARERLKQPYMLNMFDLAV